ncbi:TPA: helix-turn-helix domain-containing protein [Pseudomonas aeruginosa]|nr:helix-turn-helix domain-containing protein [Pseudomonas aeruginosa]
MPEFTTVTRVPVLTGATVDEFAAIGAAVPARASPGPATPTAAGTRSGIAGSNAPCSTYAIAALAERIGAGKSTYIGWEHDINPPPADKLIPLAKELDVSIDTILFGENAGMSAEMRDLFRRFDELSPAVKPQAKLLLRALLFSLESGAAQGEEHAA